VLVEVTFDKRVTAKFAKNVVDEAIERGQIETFGVARFDTKEAERVIQAEINWKNRK
jgi:hypothetical protein